MVLASEGRRNLKGNVGSAGRVPHPRTRVDGVTSIFLHQTVMLM